MKFKKNIPLVCVQGMGVVGSAMSVAVASANNKSKALFNVVGLEQDTKNGNEIIKKINSGQFPFLTSDKKIKDLTIKANKRKNFFATTDISYLKKAKVIISSIGLDFFSKKNSSLNNFKDAMKDVAKFIDKDALFILESSVPPGTTEKIVLPIFKNEFKKRKIEIKKINIAYSYERVMPGSNYIDSVINYWRVYSAYNSNSKKLCKNFFTKVLNVKKYPLSFLESFTACELSKMLENTFRATNIALIDEWSRFAEKNNIDLYKIIDLIKMRPTHNNIMLPGFGVGGYCLTKDPLFGEIGSKKFFNLKKISFPISKAAVKVNDKMPLAVFDEIKRKLKNLKNKNILILGATYKADIDDVRFSPTKILAKKLLKHNVKIHIYDQYVKKWDEFEKNIIDKITYKKKYDVIVLAISSSYYRNINLINISNKNKTLVIDANNVLNKRNLKKLRSQKIEIFSIGRGYIE